MKIQDCILHWRELGDIRFNIVLGLMNYSEMWKFYHVLLFVGSPAQATKDISCTGQELFCFLPRLSGCWVWPLLISTTFFLFNLCFRPAAWRSWMRRSVPWKQHYWRGWTNLGLDMEQSARFNTATTWCTVHTFSCSTSVLNVQINILVTNVDSFKFSCC